jgi:hypothetical protein
LRSVPAETQNEEEDEKGYDGNRKGVCRRVELKSAS